MSGLTSLAMLEGVWRLERRIRHDDGREDRFEGEATFSRTGPRLLHDEAGWLQPSHGGQPLRATRRYVWGRSGDQIEVSFADMRPFHSFSLATPKPTATHLCPPDRYAVKYDFTDFPDWSSTWRVEGPHKAYEMVNRFCRSPL